MAINWTVEFAKDEVRVVGELDGVSHAFVASVGDDDVSTLVHRAKSVLTEWFSRL